MESINSSLVVSLCTDGDLISQNENESVVWLYVSVEYTKCKDSVNLPIILKIVRSYFLLDGYLLPLLGSNCMRKVLTSLFKLSYVC